jgi:hypothetical protein
MRRKKYKNERNINITLIITIQFDKFDNIKNDHDITVTQIIITKNTFHKSDFYFKKSNKTIPILFFTIFTDLHLHLGYLK